MALFLHIDHHSHSFIHATGLVVGTKGILIRGESGSGKTSLALTLIRQSHDLDHYAALVGDDRLRIDSWGMFLIMRSHPATEGVAEVRNIGLREIPYIPSARVDLWVDLYTLSQENQSQYRSVDEKAPSGSPQYRHIFLPSHNLEDNSLKIMTSLDFGPTMRAWSSMWGG